ncbi:MAG: DUF2970 domain-containing protein [Gammaproteobacteria bacterium WSBS_2016_MAG_OTU1]
MNNFFLALKAAFSAFFGVRKSGELSPTLRPKHYLMAGVFMVVVFVALLIILVNFIV